MERPARGPRSKTLHRVFSFLTSGKIFLPLFVLSMFLLVKSFYGVRSKGEELSRLETEVEALEGKVEEQLGELDYRNSEEFVYKEALEQLGYTRPGEVIAVLPDFEEGKTLSAEEGASSNEEEEPSETAVQEEPAPNWKRWRILFFGS
ncbi:hypothetical protein GTO10_01685 [Candidatus Saccharibacteria bacterium]|nr:hypothetical protein [Candidatus Saccharibacteria bacterium]